MRFDQATQNSPDTQKTAKGQKSASAAKPAVVPAAMQVFNDFASI